MKPNYPRLITLIMIIAVLTGSCKNDDDNGTLEPDEKDGKIMEFHKLIIR